MYAYIHVHVHVCHILHVLYYPILYVPFTKSYTVKVETLLDSTLKGGCHSLKGMSLHADVERICSKLVIISTCYYMRHHSLLATFSLAVRLYTYMCDIPLHC